MTAKHLLLAFALCAGCADSDDVSIRIVAPDGSEVIEHSTREDLLTPALPIAFRADGVIATDAARLFDAQTLELRDPTGNWFPVDHMGNTLIRDGVTVTWDGAFNTVTARTGEAATSMTVEGLSSDMERARVLGRLAMGLLGADTGSDAKADFGATAVIALTVTYVTCITAGQAMCSETAARNCRSGVEEYKMICGAGYDVAGSFRLGFSCTFDCK
jgi:hypothetical protein